MESFAANTLCALLKREPGIILFVGMMVDQYGGALAIKGTSSTMWHVNVDISDIKATLERIKGAPYEIEV